MTEILIDNKPLPVGKESPIAKSPNRVDKMTLRYDHGLVSFKFAALNYINPLKIEYAIKLLGLRGSDTWQQIGNQRLVNFTNLPPGNYSLQIKASNDTQIWSNEIREVSLVVLPPWWRTWWAYAVYVSLTIVVAVVRLWEYRRRMRADLQMEHLQNERQRELHQLKISLPIFHTKYGHRSHLFSDPLKN